MIWTLRHSVEHSETVNGITYKIAKTREEAVDSANFFIRHFLSDEPICQSLGGVKLYDKATAVEAQLLDIVEDGVSLIAVDDSNGKLVGIRMSHVIPRSHCPQNKDSLESLLEQFPGDYARIMWLLGEIIVPKEIFEDHPGDERIFDMFALCTHPDYRGRGVAKELVNQAFKVARKVNCDSVVVLASNNATRHIFDTIGMTRIRFMDFKEVVCGGERFFKNVKSEGATGHYIKL